MKLLFFALFFVAISADARTPVRHAPAQQPVAPASAPEVAPEPLPESVPMARQLTVQEDLELRDWISGMMKEGELAKAETESAKAELKVTIERAAVAEFQANEANKKLDVVDGVISDLKQTIANDAKTIAEDAKKISKFNRIVRWLAAIAATLAALYVFQMLKPTGLIGAALSVTGPAIQYGAPLAAWVIVFGSVEVWLRYFF